MSTKRFLALAIVICGAATLAAVDGGRQVRLGDWPDADPETGNIYGLTVGAQVVALDKDGKLLWDRSIGEEFAAFTTHGGRTMSPIIDGNLVIVSAPISSWGSQAARAH